MRIRNLLWLSLVMIVGLGAVAIAAGQALPADIRLPMHWNAAGQVDRYGGKWLALLLPVAFAAGATALMAAVTRIEPNRDAVARSTGLIAVVWVGLLGLAWVIELMVLCVAFHWPIEPVRLIVGAVGLLIAAMGNQLGKSRPMYMVGIRTPWTLADPDIWIATHRLGGKLFVCAGMIWFLAALFSPKSAVLQPLLIGIMLVAALLPVAWSYILWRRAGRPGSRAS